MKLFIYEHLTSGAFCEQEFSAGLSHEGDVMLLALVHDLLALGYQLVIMRDYRLSKPSIVTDDQLDIRWIDTLASYRMEWQSALSQLDKFLVIAPETDGVLAKLYSQISYHHKAFLGCTLEAIQLCGDKLKSSQHLQAFQISSPATYTLKQWLELEIDANQQWVVKPVDGAGSEHTYLFTTSQTAAYIRGLDTFLQKGFIVQPFISGETLSLSLFIDETIHCLSINRQIMQTHGHELTLSHCEVNVPTPLSETQAIGLAQQIKEVIPGLWGFVGIDLIYSQDQLWVIEINPRLTSSYAEPAMREQQNPAFYLHQFLTAQHGTKLSVGHSNGF